MHAFPDTSFFLIWLHFLRQEQPF
ncbi:hypothetical protein Rmet_6432 [Cupriavidus metallidurans CH34]|uniref:Uncharacterized protein n=1 Tax=Cupriavidus metallidurans (strain ATCC 43123 / DSM 2839 / NBRC 102507 / CH34) TaxID=266264 RepID=D3DXM9_CUPMC|nr:hypothetical protein Rmet_6432 [Cupriavidus metallidurans CH34]